MERNNSLLTSRAADRVRMAAATIAVLLAPMMAFATLATDKEAGGLGTVVKNLYDIITGPVAGIAIAAIFVFMMIKAFGDENQGPQMRKKAIIGGVVTIALIIFMPTAMTVILGKTATGGALDGLNGAIYAGDAVRTSLQEFLTGARL